MIWYSHLLKNFPRFVVILTIKGFSIVNEAEVFLERRSFLHDPVNVGNLTLVPLPLQNPACTPFLFFTLIISVLSLFVFISLARNLSLLLSFPKSCVLLIFSVSYFSHLF